MEFNRLIWRESLSIIVAARMLLIYAQRMAKPKDMQKCFALYIIKGMAFLYISYAPLLWLALTKT